MSRGVAWVLAGNETVVRVASDGDASEPGEVERWGLRDPRSGEPGEAARFEAELGDADWFGRS